VDPVTDPESRHSDGRALQSSRDQPDHHGVVLFHDVLANAVRAERSRRRWTQAELAERLAMPRTSVADIESGRRRLTLDDLAAICTVYDLPLIALCAGADRHQLRTLGLTRRSWDD
jgi:ribosome-binding protein aMBF1 (putative translation factor)